MDPELNVEVLLVLEQLVGSSSSNGGVSGSSSNGGGAIIGCSISTPVGLCAVAVATGMSRVATADQMSRRVMPALMVLLTKGDQVRQQQQGHECGATARLAWAGLGHCTSRTIVGRYVNNHMHAHTIAHACKCAQRIPACLHDASARRGYLPACMMQVHAEDTCLPA